jgi:hypothetical protein
LLTGDAIELQNTDEKEIGIQTLPLLIKSWNFTDEEGKDIPVNYENLKILPATDIEYLISQIQEHAASTKKV